MLSMTFEVVMDILLDEDKQEINDAIMTQQSATVHGVPE